MINQELMLLCNTAGPNWCIALFPFFFGKPQARKENIPCYIMQKQNQQVEVQVLQYQSNDTDILPCFCSLSSVHVHGHNLLLFLNKLNSNSIRTGRNFRVFLAPNLWTLLMGYKEALQAKTFSAALRSNDP